MNEDDKLLKHLYIIIDDHQHHTEHELLVHIQNRNTKITKN